MNIHKSLYKRAYLIVMIILGLSLGSLSACSNNNDLNVNNQTSSIKMVSKSSTNTASINPDQEKNPQQDKINIIKPEKKIIKPKKPIINYRSNKFHSNNKMVLLDSKNAKISIPTIKEQYLYKDVSELISNKGKPDYFLREVNTGVLRYTINNCPVIFFVVRENKSNRIDNIKSVCEKEERTE